MDVNPKRILIAVDASENSERAVAYVGDVLCHAREAEILLLCIAKTPDRDLFPDEASWRMQAREQESEYARFLDRARDILSGRGVDSACIEKRLAPYKGPSIAQDILNVQREESFGTVVVGRRGVSREEEFLFGSVSSRIIHHARNCAVWVVE